MPKCIKKCKKFKKNAIFFNNIVIKCGTVKQKGENYGRTKKEKYNKEIINKNYHLGTK